MPPKRAPNTAASFTRSVNEVLDGHGITSKEQISDSLLRKLYRLQDASEGISSTSGPSSSRSTSKVKAIHDLRACTNAWDTPEKRKKAIVLEVKKINKGKRKADDTTDDSDSDTERAIKASLDNRHDALDPWCDRDRCKDNPRCLNWLGQYQWEAKGAFEKFRKRWGLPDDPAEDACDEGTPVGLKNLAATCYANSFLQLWFQDEVFRRAIFAYELDPHSAPETQPMSHLQVLFAALQSGKSRYFDPAELMKCLKLDVQEQQDAQEFAKLFLDVISRTLQRQRSDQALSRAVSDRFYGKRTYGTRCHACRNASDKTDEFRELELPSFKKEKSLSAFFEEMLATERMDGDNKYECGYCGKKQIATRYMRIDSLPPVLHLSIQRFDYDYDKEERRKIGATITFPLSIDMSKYIGDQDQPRGPPMWYDLRGQLLHKGDSAFCGHYVAQIHDERYNKWFLFDDETVSEEDIMPKVKTSKAPSSRSTNGKDSSVLKPRSQGQSTVSGDAFYSSSQSSRKESSAFSHAGPTGHPHHMTVDDSGSDGEMRKPVVITRTYKSASSDSKKKRRIAAESDEESDDEQSSFERNGANIHIKSKNAYLLVYVRRPDGAAPHYRGSAQASSSPSTAAPKIPALALQKLEDITNVQIGQQMAYNAERELCRADFDAYRQKKMSVYHNWHTTSDTETGALVDKNELERWMLAELEAPKKNGVKKQVTQNVASSTDDDCITVTASQASRSPRKDSRASPTQGAIPKPNGRSQTTPAPLQNGSGEGKERAFTEPRSSHMEIDSTDDENDLPSALDIANGSAKSRRYMPGSFTPFLKASGSTPVSPSKTSLHSHNGTPSSSSQLPTNGVQPMDIDAKDADAMGTAAAAPRVEQTPTATELSDRRRKNKLEPVTHLVSSSLRCPHGLVSISKFSSMKRVSLAGAAALRKLGITLDPPFSDTGSLCKECVWAPWGDLAYTQRHIKDLTRYSQIVAKDHRHAVYVSSQWMRTWLREKPVFHDAGGHVDLAPDWGIYGEHVTCKHGNLEPEEDARCMITSKQAAFLKTLFPTWQPRQIEDDGRVCHICDVVWQAKRDQRRIEAHEAKSLARNRDLKRLLTTFSGIRGEYVPTENGERMYAVPIDWLNGVRKWSKGTSKKMDKPGAIDLRDEFCHHDKLLVDLNSFSDRRDFELVGDTEWAALVTAFGCAHDLQISVKLSDNKKTLLTRPRHCDECRHIQRAARDEYDIKLVFHLPADLVNGRLPARDESPAEYIGELSDTSGLRRSSRATKGRVGTSDEARLSAHRRRPTTMELRSDDTLRTIRIRIAEAHKMPIMVQRIWYNGREIDNADETVQSIGIVEGETLQVIECSNEMNPVDLCATDEEDRGIITVGTRAGSNGRQGGTGSKSNRRAKRNGRLEGFGGTGLQGFDGSDDHDEMGMASTSRSSRSSVSDNTPAAEERARTHSEETQRITDKHTQEQQDRERHAQHDRDMARRVQEAADEQASRALAEQLQAEENARQNGSLAPKPRKGRVQCEACTLENDEKQDKCEACETPLR